MLPQPKNARLSWYFSRNIFCELRNPLKHVNQKQLVNVKLPNTRTDFCLLVSRKLKFTPELKIGSFYLIIICRAFFFHPDSASNSSSLRWRKFLLRQLFLPRFCFFSSHYTANSTSNKVKLIAALRLPQSAINQARFHDNS